MVIAFLLAGCGSGFPGLVGESVTAAGERLDELEIEYSVEYETSNDVPQDEVIRTEPESGADLDGLDEALLVVSLGTDVEVPDLGGMELDDARDVVRDASLDIGRVERRTAEPDEGPGTVVEQEPSAREVVAPDSEVALVVAESVTISGTLILVAEVDSLRARPLATDDGGESTSWFGRNESFEGQWCAGARGYDDLSGGAGVTVRDGSGATAATGRLDDGEGLWRGSDDWNALDGDYWACKFTYEVTDVPPSEFYEIEVSRRGVQVYSHDELAARNFELQSSIGR